MFTVGNIGFEAKVFIDPSQIDTETIKQIERISAHPSVAKPRIMPDCHKGNGCCVGFTCELGMSVLPGLIGGDIGCGICLHPLSADILSKRNSLEKIDRIIHAAIPMGNGHDKIHRDAIILEEQYATFLEDAQQDAIRFCTKYEDKFEVSIRQYMPHYDIEWLKLLCERIESDYEYDLRCMGTLGGGNHFVEVNTSENGVSYLTVHSGSRNIGHKIAEYHSKILNTAIRHEEVKGGASEFLPLKTREDLADDEDIGDVHLEPHVAGLSGEQAACYFFDMIWAQTWAKMNRRCILSSVLMKLNVEFRSDNVTESVHNYIDFRDMIIRKGAISAKEGESCVIALNMRDGILICKGIGNEDWNYSAPHGCGRIVSRKLAGKASSKKSRSKKDRAAALAKFEAEMEGVHSSCISLHTIDERPSAYRDAQIIMESIGATAIIECHAQTVLNVKGF